MSDVKRYRLITACSPPVNGPLVFIAEDTALEDGITTFNNTCVAVQLARLLLLLNARHEHATDDPHEPLACQEGRRAELEWLIHRYTREWMKLPADVRRSVDALLEKDETP